MGLYRRIALTAPSLLGKHLRQFSHATKGTSPLMFQASPPIRDPWWIRVSYIVLGAIISAVVGWFGSLYNHYRDSRKQHSNALKRHVLEPLKAATVNSNLAPVFEVKFGTQTINPNLGVSEYAQLRDRG
jgi:hypothetical protein